MTTEELIDQTVAQVEARALGADLDAYRSALSERVDLSVADGAAWGAWLREAEDQYLQHVADHSAYLRRTLPGRLAAVLDEANRRGA